MGTLEGGFTITVGADGVASFDGTLTATGSWNDPNLVTLDTPVTVTGTKTPTGFEFPSFFGGPDSFAITVSGDRGTGTLVEGARPGLVSIEVAFDAVRA